MKGRLKRPLAWVCAAGLFLLILVGQFEGITDNLLPRRAALLLETCSQKQDGLVLTGKIHTINAAADGFRIVLSGMKLQTAGRSSDFDLSDFVLSDSDLSDSDLSDSDLSDSDLSDSDLSSSYLSEANQLSGTSDFSDLKLSFTITEEEQARFSLAPGDRITVEGTYQSVQEATNPGQFDAQDWYFSQDQIGFLYEVKIRNVETGGLSLKKGLFLVREALRRSCQSILEEPYAGTLCAILLGEKNSMESEWKELFQEGGISHILAISGLHISMIGQMFYGLLRRLGASFGFCFGAGGLLVALYAGMTGAGISTLRAVIMFGLWMGAQICGRKYDSVTATAIAAFLLILADARNIRQASFWLSFAAVLCTGLLLPCLQKLLHTKEHRWMQSGPVQGLLGSLCVWIGTLPCTLFFYYQTEPWSILANLLVIPLMSSLMMWGLAAAAAGLAWQSLGRFLAAPVSYLLALFAQICRAERFLPGGVLVLGRPSLPRIAVYYALLALLLFLADRPAGLKRTPGALRTARDTPQSEAAHPLGGKYAAPPARPPVSKISRRMRMLSETARWCGCALACFGFVLLLALRSSSENLRILCLDVGQGDCALLQLPGGTTAFIDCGSSSKSSVWENIAQQAAKYYGIRRIDYFFLTHADADHINGAEEYLETYETGITGENIHGLSLGALVLPYTDGEEDFQELLELAGRNHIPVYRMEAGAVLDGRKNGRETVLWSLTCVSPAQTALTGDRNEDSLVLFLQCGTFRMLFTGDLEGGQEQLLAQSDSLWTCNVLKAGHHGSKNASSEAFLEAVSPQAAIISCGKNNRYGHPAMETLNRLIEAGAEIFQTQEGGAVEIRKEQESDTYKIFQN